MQWNEFRFHIRHLPSSEQKMVQKAFEVGARAHADQKRQSGEPYFTHPIAVAQILINLGADADTIMAALLHDTTEDTPMTLKEIEESFNPTVAMLVDGVTKLSHHDLGGRPTLNERVETLRKMFTLMQTDIRIMVIKLADRLHNMQTISFRPIDKQKAVAQETLDVYVKIADRLCMRDIRDTLEDMCYAILEPDMHLQVLELRKKNEEESRVLAPMMAKRLEADFQGLPFEIEFEQKSWTSARHECDLEAHGHAPKTSIVLALLCNSVDDCYHTLGLLHQTWRRETLTFQDYINNPLINGYKALHTTIILEDGTRIRCKIRTDEMDEYAHRGISVHCFEPSFHLGSDSLEWTSRISPVSEDTAERSNEFWVSLQNDILGESILIHGESDQTQLLPKGSTALDAVLYLYGRRGLFAKKIYINGESASFYKTIEYAQTVTADFAQTPQVTLPWLQYTNTGVGTALIRNGLAEQDEQVKQRTGQNLLQEYFNARRRGFISEFNPSYIQKVLEKNGYGTMDDVYVQIAEGRRSVAEVEDMFFAKQVPKNPQNKERHIYTLTCHAPLEKKALIQETLKYYNIRKFRTIHENSAEGSYKFVLLLTEEEFETLSYTLQNIIGDNFNMRKTSIFLKTSIFSIVLFLLWGLDPTIAHLLLKRPGISPIDLTVVRFFSLTALSGVFLLAMHLRRPLPQARLSLRSTTLWLSVLFLFCVSITTYYSLQNTLPSQYTIPMTSAGLFLTSIVQRRRLWVMLSTWSLVAIGVLLMIVSTPGWTLSSIFFTLLAVISFTGFSVISERYKREENVSLRAAQYFFVLSTLCSLLCIFVWPYVSLTDISLRDFISIILFSIFVSGIPYYIYYYLLSHKEIDFVLRYSFLIIPATMLSEFLLVGHPLPAIIFAAVIVSIGALMLVYASSKIDTRK